MSQYDFWAYELCNDLVVYIPSQDYVVKRVDFIDWGLGNKLTPTVELCREQLSPYLPKDISWESLEKKPDSDNILYITLAEPLQNLQHADGTLVNDNSNSNNNATELPQTDFFQAFKRA